MQFNSKFNKLTSIFFLCALATVLVFSCKKDPAEPIVVITTPTSGAEYSPSSVISFLASATCSEDMLLVHAFLKNPQGDTLYEEEFFNAGKEQSIAFNYRHHVIHGQGDFSFHVVAYTDIVTTQASRSLKIGESGPVSLDFAYARVTNESQNSHSFEIYDKTGSIAKQYNVQTNSSYSTSFYSFGQEIYYYNDYEGKIMSFEGFTGKDLSTVAQSAGPPSTYGKNNFYLYGFNATSDIRSYYEDGTSKNQITPTYQTPSSIYEDGDLLFTSEWQGNTPKLNVYHKNTGSLLNTMNVPDGEIIRGFYSLGDPNRIYFLTYYWGQDATRIWYYNKSQNAISQLSTTVSGEPKFLNPTEIREGVVRAWIYTDEGMFQHQVGDVIFQTTISSVDDASGIEEYQYDPNSNNIIIKYDANWNSGVVVHDITNDATIASYPYGERILLLFD